MNYVSLLLLALLAASPASADHELDGRDLANGEALYAEHCAECHGANLEGQPDWRSPGEDGVLPAPPHDATGHTWHHSNAHLFDYTALGGAVIAERAGVSDFVSGMPGFAEALEDREIWDVLAFIASTWPEREATVQAARNPAH